MQLEKLLENVPKTDSKRYRALNQSLFESLEKTCVIIDDDPTGNQTVYDIPLLTSWDVQTLEQEFNNKTKAFFLLTNSRSLPAFEVAKIYHTIAQNSAEASKKTGRDFSIISRSDSTLRGHFQTELTAIRSSGIYKSGAPLNVFIPVMFEGGRITINHTHYIQEGTKLTPVNVSPFAQDSVFGYQHADLKKWIAEKTTMNISESEIYSFSLSEIRNSTVAELSEKLLNFTSGNYILFDAITYQDLDKITNTLLVAEQKGGKFLYRTSSSFLPSYLGIPTKKLLTGTAVLTKQNTNAGLVIVGSHVPKSSSQLDYLLNRTAPESAVELDLRQLFDNNQSDYLSSITEVINTKIKTLSTVILYTSRKLITGTTTTENLSISHTISNALVSLVQKLEQQPKYLLAKGGITSHDIATKGLGMKRGLVIGQLIPGVPVWQLSTETKFPDLAYVVFPGNVGDETSIYQAINQLNATR